jgi:DNA-binding transcriptional MerR regulator
MLSHKEVEMSQTKVTIGIAAQLLGVSTKTLRHYQGLGLLSDAQRARNSYRLFGAADLLRVQQIRSLQGLGLSLTQIQTLLGAPGDEPSLRSALAQILADVEAQLAQLEARRTLLVQLLAADVRRALDTRPLTPSSTARLLTEALGAVGDEVSPWMRDADAHLLGQFDTVHGNDPAYRAQVQELARLAAAHPAAYQKLVALGRRLEALRESDPTSPEVADLATAYRLALAENVVMQAAAALPIPDGPAAQLLGDLLGLAAPLVLSPAQLRVFELAGADPADDGPGELTE